MACINRMYTNEKNNKTGIVLGDFLENRRKRNEAWFRSRLQ